VRSIDILIRIVDRIDDSGTIREKPAIWRRKRLKRHLSLDGGQSRASFERYSLRNALRDGGASVT
jgi:hypothetical protein